MKRGRFFLTWSFCCLVSGAFIGSYPAFADTMDTDDIEKYKNLMAGAQRRLEQKNLTAAEKNCTEALNFAGKFDDEFSKTGPLVCLAQILDLQSGPKSGCEYWLRAAVSADAALVKSGESLARIRSEILALKSEPSGSDELRDRKVEAKTAMMEFVENDVKARMPWIDGVRTMAKSCQK